MNWITDGERTGTSCGCASLDPGGASRGFRPSGLRISERSDVGFRRGQAKRTSTSEKSSSSRWAPRLAKARRQWPSGRRAAISGELKPATNSSHVPTRSPSPKISNTPSLSTSNRAPRSTGRVALTYLAFSRQPMAGAGVLKGVGSGAPSAAPAKSKAGGWPPPA